MTGLVITATGASGSNFLLDSIRATPTPEPGTALLLVLPALLALIRLRKKN